MHPLQKLCENRSITRYRLAKKSGIYESTITNIIARNTAVKKINLGIIINIAKGLDLSVDCLVEELLSFEKNDEDN
jgi:DNA-binding Xre family transcriptional regulator